MSRSLLMPQGNLSLAEVKKVAQEAPTILRNNPKAISQSPLVSLFTTAETADLWTTYENLLLSCLRTGRADDLQSAHQCLDRLVLRFGESNERIMALAGIVQEAEAGNDADKLHVVLKSYENVLHENPANIVR
jgi:ER membrane protein complex subunit 2